MKNFNQMNWYCPICGHHLCLTHDYGWRAVCDCGWTEPFEMEENDDEQRIRQNSDSEKHYEG